ncbi:hypothetical protein [Mesorhizobium sp. M1396]|uniref:hypothetical protein n=1 Tax=Mesorhizobium sp. M1396 TaxID=2957095 RepID=UPI00333B92B0
MAAPLGWGARACEFTAMMAWRDIRAELLHQISYLPSRKLREETSTANNNLSYVVNLSRESSLNYTKIKKTNCDTYCHMDVSSHISRRKLLIRAWILQIYLHLLH